MGRVIKLIYISVDDGKTEQSNKFYNMTEKDDGTFLAEWGRVGAAGQSQVYSISKWDSTYKSKTKKGYKDNTELFIVEGKASTDSDSTYKEFSSKRSNFVKEIVTKLQSWAKGSIKQNYTVTSEQVTQKQVDKAQSVLDQIVAFDVKKTNIDEFNKLLIEFYGIVPRKMKNVKDHLLNIDIKDLTEKKNQIITEEQATLDVMSGQVQLQANIKESDGDAKEVTEVDILDVSGMNVVEVNDSSVITKIKKLMGDNSYQFKQAFEVINNTTQSKYNNAQAKAKNKQEELLWHGSRNENWWSILTTGLLIRPSNAVHTGSMFGDGVYFADKFRKSYGYTSGRGSYFAKGSSNECVLALYSVHVGEQMHINKHSHDHYSLNYQKIQKNGHDSVFAHGGADLQNNEYIVYTSEQSTVKYLVIVNAI